MFGTIALAPRSIDDYREVVGDNVIDELRALAEPLQGKRVLCLCSPAANRAVRAVLESTVPLMVDMGINAQWQQLRMPVEFQEMDTRLRRALSTADAPWTRENAAQWEDFNEMNARLYDEDFDVVVSHHTASISLYDAITRVQGQKPAGAWIWHAHRDYRGANPEVWEAVMRHAAGLAAAVSDYPEFAGESVPNRVKVVIRPGVDPLGASTQPVSQEVRRALLAQRGIDLDQPILCQVSRANREEYPVRVMDAYELIKAYRPEAQLVLVNLSGIESTELQKMMHIVNTYQTKVGNILLLTDLDRVGNVELASLRQEATVIMHQGLPHGISMELLEEMWQSKPIVGGRSSVATATLQHERTGLLADTPLEQAEAVLSLLESPRYAQRMGNRAHSEIARRYMVTHHLRSYLRLMQRLLRKSSRKNI
jgi:trehalose synthase